MTRIERLRERLLPGFSAALIEDRYHRAYLTGFRSSAGTLLITEDGAWLIADGRYIEAAGRADGVTVLLRDGDLDGQIAALLRRCGAARILVEDEMPLGRFLRLRRVLGDLPVSDGTLSAAVRAMRAVKEPGEIAAIRAAQAVTGAAFEAILNFIRPGVTERQIAARLEYEMRCKGADKTAFDTIAVGGENSSLPHGEPGDRPVGAGDFVTMDFGAVKDGYCSDMTRTVAVGRADERMREVYAAVLAAHLAAREQARAGMTGAALDGIARKIIGDAGYGDYFGHSLGHSLGLEIHEDPRASAGYTERLPIGSVMTVEPGIYLPGAFGVRIENMILLSVGGNENLTDSPTDLVIL